MNIYQKMAAITAELRTVAKNLTVETGNGNRYKAVSERDVIDAIKPLESKYGIYSYPRDRVVIESQTLESENTYNGNVTKKTTFFARIQTTYRFVNVDDPSEYIETITFAEGIDPQDKGSGKAMTYGDKYALMKAYKISTGDDPDQQASTEESYTVKNYKKSDPMDELQFCEQCGGAIIPYKGKDGKTVMPAKHIAASVEKFGKILCVECITK